MALEDATLQRACLGKDKKKLAKCAEAKSAVKNYIDAVFDENAEPDFDETIEAVESGFQGFLSEKDDGALSFGNAQKLINMTAKYMFMATYRAPESRVLFKGFHCPMDSVTIC